jgi:hypothetical protein
MARVAARLSPTPKWLRYLQPVSPTTLVSVKPLPVHMGGSARIDTSDSDLRVCAVAVEFDRLGIGTLRTVPSTSSQARQAAKR